MEATKMAPISIISGDKELETIESERIMRVLVIEDEPYLRNNIQQKLEELGCSVDAVASPKEAATLIEEDKYQLLIVDIRFNAPNIPGDEFVRKNMDILSGGKRVAFTGYVEDISSDNEPFFDEIIEKGSLGDPLYECAGKIYEERRGFVAKSIKDNFLQSVGNETDSEWALSEKTLINTLIETEDKDEMLVWYKGRDLSANELIEEVKDRESEIGKSHIRMMLNWIRKKKAD